MLNYPRMARIDADIELQGIATKRRENSRKVRSNSVCPALVTTEPLEARTLVPRFLFVHSCASLWPSLHLCNQWLKTSDSLLRQKHVEARPIGHECLECRGVG
jgi:hypothetical protein